MFHERYGNVALWNVDKIGKRRKMRLVQTNFALFFAKIVFFYDNNKNDNFCSLHGYVQSDCTVRLENFWGLKKRI